MGRNCSPLGELRNDDSRSQQGLVEAVYQLGQVFEDPEQFNDSERANYVRLLKVAMLARNTELNLKAVELVIKMEAENQRRERLGLSRCWPTA